jgi:hypothetical protein
MKKLCPDSKDIPSIEKLCRDSEDTKDVLCPEYPESIPKYVKERVEWNKVGPHCSVFGFACDFPQESTEDQSYTEKQFKAYRDLGKWIVENQCDFATRMCPDKTSVPRLVEELDTAMRQKDVTKAKVVLVKLHDILVRNANLEANSTKRTMSDDDLRGVLAQLRPLALKESQVMLVQPSQLKDIKIDVFQNYFVPFPQTPAAGEKVTSGTGGGGGQSRSRPRVGYGCDRMSCRSG